MMCISAGFARVRFLLFVVGCMVATGCGGPKTIEVSGEVTFAGKPIPAGRIYFNPDVTKGNQGPQGYAEIHDGKFDTRKGGKGPVGGPTVVVIHGHERSTKENPPPGWMGDRLFKEYEMPVELPHENSTRTFDVPAAAGKDLPPPNRGGGV